MVRMRGGRLVPLGVGVVMACAGTARAETLEYIVEWSGEAYGNDARATGSLVLDATLIAQPGSLAGAITGFEMTVEKAGAGNGTFGLEDFALVIFEVQEPLDLTTELVGQRQGGGSTWGLGAWDPEFNFLHDFNVFADLTTTPNAPFGSFFYEVRTNGGGGEVMRLTSLRPIPAPGGMALLAVAGVAVARRRRRER